MRILIVWDDAGEADLMNLYLGTGENQATITMSVEEFLAKANAEPWDAVLMTMCFPKTVDEGLNLFVQIQQILPGVPVVVACRSAEMINLPRFLTRGLRFYVIRDPQGDFIFLLLSSIESAMAAGRAEESRKLAERLREEMDGVRKLQESIIPQGLHPPKGYKAAARYEPSQVTVVGDRPVVMAGGDYYDLFSAGESTLISLIGDASGHGLKACMSIMAMHTLIRMFTGDHYRDTAKFVSEINSRLCDNSIVQSEGGFITLFYAALDTTTHTLNWTSAGHPPALLHNLKTNEVIQVGKDSDGGLPLGVAPGIDYESFALHIPPCSRVLIFSDGLTDAMPATPGAKAYGVKGIADALRTCQGKDLEFTLNELFRSSSAYTNGVGRHDDTSVVLLERSGE